MKRLIVAVLLAAMLAGCSPSTKGDSATGHLDPKNPVTVTLWHYYVSANQQALEAAVYDFNQTVGIDQGVIIDAVAMGSIAELEDNVTRSAMGVINALPMPQIFSSYPDKAMEIDALGAVADLSDYFSPDEQALFVEGFLSDGIFDGDRLLVLPIVKSTELMYVNATAWHAFADQLGLTESALSTWEGALETSRQFYHWTDAQTPDTPWDGTALMGMDSVANYVIMGCRQMGLKVIDSASGEQGAAVLDKAVLRRLFDNYFTGIALGYYDAQSKFRSDDIKAGSMIAYVGSSSSAAYFPTWIERDGAKQPIDFMPLPYPVFQDGSAGAIQQGAGMCIAKSTPAQQEGAAIFLKWFTASQQNIDFAMNTGYLPVQKQAYSADAFEAALDQLRSGDQSAQNVAGVYQIALGQITQATAYAATPFTGSYHVRSVLQSTLIDAGLQGRQAAELCKAQGMTDEQQILEALDIPARFDAWIDSIAQGLGAKSVQYIIP